MARYSAYRAMFTGNWQILISDIADTHCLGRDIPMVRLIGGGYAKDRHALARHHGILPHSAAKVWDERGLGRA